MKIENIKRFGAYAAVFVMATSGVALSTRTAQAEGITETKPAIVSLVDDVTKKAKNGTIIDVPIEIDGVWYYRYKVKENDTASRISTTIVNFFNKKGQVPQEDKDEFKANPNATCRYWPAVANDNLNKHGNFSIHPGDVIKFRISYAELKRHNVEVKANGWYAAYVQKHHIYKNKKVYIDKEEARRMVQEVYRYLYPEENIIITDEFVDAYLKLHSYSGNFVYKDGAKLDKEQTWEFYEWLPTKEDIYNKMEQPGKKQGR